MTDRPLPNDSAEPTSASDDKTFGYVGGDSTSQSRRDISTEPDNDGNGTMIGSATPASSRKYAKPKEGADSAEAVWIGHYRVIGELGRGGMGMVCKVQHRIMPRIAALKMILQGDLAGEEQRRRFEIDAAALATLEHDSIVRMYEYGEHNRNPYFVMEFVDGGSLADGLHGKPPMDFARAASLIRKIARGVAYAHQKGIVHRDLKPGNILMTHDGLPRITDFGLARMQSERSANASEGGQPLTPAGQIMGTPAYMAPEQATGVADNSDHRVDIYSLGAILYELLAGRPPYKGNQMEILRLLWSRTPPTPLLELRPDLPEDLEAVCNKCMAWEASDRYFSARELVIDLERMESNLPTSGAVHVPSGTMRPSPSSMRSPLSALVLSQPGFLRRHPRKFAIAALSLLAVAVWFGSQSLAASNLRHQSRERIRAAETAMENQDRREALRLYGNAFDSLAQLRTRNPESSAYRHEVGRILLKKGIILCDLREWDDAGREFDRALEELKASAQVSTGFDSQLLRAEVYHNLGILYRDRSVVNYAEARRNWLTAYDHFKTAKGFRETLTKSSMSIEMEKKLDRDLARSHGYIGDVEVQLGRLVFARESYLESLRLRRKLAAENPDELDYQMQCCRGEQNLCRLYACQGKLAEAKVACRKGLDYLDPHIDSPSTPPDLKRDYIAYHLLLAELTMDLKQSAGASESLAKAAAVCEPLSQANPNDPFFLSKLVRLNLDQAKLDFLSGDRPSALRNVAEGQAILEQIPRDKRQPDDRIADILMASIHRKLADSPAARDKLLYKCEDELTRAHNGGYNSFVGFKNDIAGRLLMDAPEFAANVETMHADSFPKDAE